MYTLNTGIELELWVVDDSGRLCDGTAITESHERIEPEFIDSLIEVQTAAHSVESDLQRDLQSTLRVALDAAAAEGCGLVPLGTPLSACDAEANCERGRVFERLYGDGVHSAKNCAGTHIHFEKDNPVAQLNLLTALDPALALVSSSPYYDSERGASSARALAYRTKCPDQLRCCTDLWEYTDSIAEWRERIHESYETFKRLAAERGVSVDQVERLFDPEDTVLNPVRLRECQPTVEWRAPDATLPSQVLRLATDVGDLMSQTRTAAVDRGPTTARAEEGRLPEFSSLRALSRAAIADGLESAAVRSYLSGLGFDLSEYDPISPQLAGRARLSDDKVRTVRLQQARRLRADVESLTRTAPEAL